MKLAGLAAAIFCLLVVGGCGLVGLLWGGGPQYPASELAALGMARRVLPAGYSGADLSYRRVLRSGGQVTGYAWRVATGGGGATTARRATHLGVLACVRGEQATGAVRFSYLHWQPAGCNTPEPLLAQRSRTPEQDARALGQPIQGPTGVEGSAKTRRTGR